MSKIEWFSGTTSGVKEANVNMRSSKGGVKNDAVEKWALSSPFYTAQVENLPPINN